MKIRRGCGCPVLLLGVANLFMVIASVVGLVRGSGSSATGATSLTTVGLVGFLFIYVGNVLVCLLIGLAALRGGIESGGVGGQPASAELYDEGEDVPDDGPSEDDSQSATD